MIINCYLCKKEISVAYLTSANIKCFSCGFLHFFSGRDNLIGGKFRVNHHYLLFNFLSNLLSIYPVSPSNNYIQDGEFVYQNYIPNYLTDNNIKAYVKSCLKLKAFQ